LRALDCPPFPGKHTWRNDAQRRVCAGIFTRPLQCLPIDEDRHARTNTGVDAARSLVREIDFAERLNGTFQESGVVLRSKQGAIRVQAPRL